MCTVILKREEGRKARGLDCDQRGDQDGPRGSMMVLSPHLPTQALKEPKGYWRGLPVEPTQ